MSAQQTVEARSDREFRFVLTCEAYKREATRKDILLWPYNSPKKAVNAAQAQFGTSPSGVARFSIKQSRTSPGGEAVGGKDLGRIDWIGFEVEITLP